MSAPTIINAKATPTSTSLALAWGVSTEETLDKIRVYLRPHGTGPWLAEDVPASARSHTFTGLNPNTPYDWELRPIIGGAAVTGTASTSAPTTPPAPVLSVQGNTVSWPAIPGVKEYTFATVRHPSTTRDTTYQPVAGTSITPPVVSGETVNYGCRADLPVAGPWAKEVPISYPLPPAPPAASVVVGVNGASGWGPSDAALLLDAGFKAVRFEDGVASESAQTQIANKFTPALCSVVVGNTNDGASLAALSIPAWTAATLGRVEALYALGFTTFEAGNEMYLKANAFDSKTYAAMVMALYDAIDAAGLTGKVRVGVSCVNDTPRGKVTAGGGWLREMIAAQVRLARRADYWVTHPYPAESGNVTDTGWMGNCGPVAVENQIAVANALGVKNNVWALTEFGVQLKGPAYATGDPAHQAAMVKAYMTAFLMIPQVISIYYFSIHDTGEGSFGLVTTPSPPGPLPWEPRPSLAVVAGLANA
jgi:hypothetical protein